MGISMEQIVINDQEAQKIVAAAKEYRKTAEAALRAREEKLTAELERDEERRLAADMALREKKIVAEIAAKQKEVERLAAEMEKRFADQKQTWIDGVVRQITEAAE